MRCSGQELQSGLRPLSDLDRRSYTKGTGVDFFSISGGEKQFDSGTFHAFATEWLIGLEGMAIELPEKFRPENEFIEWHNKNIFLNP